MATKTIIEFLNEESVTIVKKNIINYEGKEYYIGDPNRCSYINDEQGRELLSEQVSDPYYSAIMEIWGDHPTVFHKLDRRCFCYDKQKY